MVKQDNRAPQSSEVGNVPAPHGARLDRALARTSDAPLREGNRLVLLENGPNTYNDWLAAIGRARRWVHLENYIFQDDGTGKRFAEALTARAAEGIPVRALFDGASGLSAAPGRETERVGKTTNSEEGSEA
jgi:cardiolipin synthase A/B